jgi:hypothetical protein
MNARFELIALAGVSGAGKDTAGEYLRAQHGYVRVAIADPLKQVMMSLFGLERDDLWGEARNRVHPRLGRPQRELYQQFGKACREIDPDVWIRHFRGQVRRLLDDGQRVVCTDLRMERELDAVRELGGAAWLITRHGSGAPGAMAGDQTETELGSADENRFQSVIRNDGSLADLHRSLAAALLRGRVGARA